MKCTRCGLNAESELCFRCKRRKPIPVRRALPRAVNTEILEIKTKETGRMRAFFLSLWMRRPHYSELPDHTYLGREPLSVFFHHILSKNKYPQAMYDEDNIILLTLLQHSSVESDMYKYPEINRRRELLKTKYQLS